MHFRLLIALTFLFAFSARGQEQRSRAKKLVAISDTLVLDSLSIVPGSLSVFNGTGSLDTSYYKLLFAKKALVLNRKLLTAQNIQLDSLTLFYRVFPLDFSKEVYHKDVKQLQKDLSIPQNPFTIRYNTNQVSADLFASDGLSKNGSISRGISFGNNQDVVVNSNLNLQVSGKLTRDIEITLAATDNNIPIQPEGNSQQLQEFDKVYVQLNDKSSRLIVGDYQMQRPNSYFMSFYKRAQGLYFSNDYKLTATGVLKSTVAGALSRGKFNRQVFRGIENNQGPYRLTGADNELFIVVLSGTERVYIDGRLLTRGQENDYVIDYNSAQIIFTAKQLITKDKRITVEFQYSEKNYQRSIYYINEEYHTKKLRLALSYYSEQDNKNKSLQQTLSTADRQLLFDIGDTLSQAYTSGAVLTPFNTTEVFYRRMDTLAGSGTYPIYLYTTSEEDSVYRVRFSYTGPNAGNYVQIQSAANGKVYQWVEPAAGVPQGSYEPIVPLVTPKRRQMVTTVAEYKISKHGLLGAEGAFTSNDVNTFSPHDKANDDGQGAKLYFTDKTRINRPDSGRKELFLNYGAGYEFLQKNFSQIERFRGVEFFRDWNRTSDSVFNDQHIASASVGLSLGHIVSSQYTGSGFLEGDLYQGIRHNLNNTLNLKNTKAFYNGSYLTTDDSPLQTSFYRHRSRISQKAGPLLFTYLDELEKNEFKYTPTDSLLRRSYQFWEWEGNVTNADTSNNRYKVFYRERIDRFAYREALFEASRAQNVGFSAEINSIRNHPFKTTLTYRRLDIIDSVLIAGIRPDNNLLSRVEYAPRLFKGFFQASTFYEVGYGLEQKKEYSYVQVAAGQGQYYWNDYNKDGIKQLNEFEIAQYPDQMIYIRIYTPTNTFVKSARDQFSFSLYLRPSVFRTEHSGKFMDALGRFVSQTAYRVDKKTYAPNGQVMKFNPFEIDVADTNLISTNYNFRQSLFFNQSSPVFGFDYTYQDNKSKQLLTNGYESRELLSHELRTRWNVTRAWGFFTTSSFGGKKAVSQFFASRNFTLQILEAEPKISYQPNTAFRLSALFKYTEKLNTLAGGGQKAVVQDYALEFKLNKLSKGSFNARFDYLYITYNDEENSPLAFEMLSSLRPGQNITWNASYQQNLSGNIQISFTYDGRSAPGTKIIHIGGAQVRAFF